MAEVECVDGCVLSIVPVPKTDRRGTAYETTLRLLLDGEPFGEVGECSGWQLSRAAEQVREAQAQDGPQALPGTSSDALLQRRASDGLDLSRAALADLRRLLPRDRELLCLRSRDPSDGDGGGELRVWLRDDRTWLPGRDGAPGRWSTRSRAVLDGWGDTGRGVRCLLDGHQLLRLLEVLIADAAAVGSAPSDTGSPTSDARGASSGTGRVPAV